LTNIRIPPVPTRGLSSAPPGPVISPILSKSSVTLAQLFLLADPVSTPVLPPIEPKATPGPGVLPAYSCIFFLALALTQSPNCFNASTSETFRVDPVLLAVPPTVRRMVLGGWANEEGRIGVTNLFCVVGRDEGPGV
jgi:hypothetical protein